MTLLTFFVIGINLGSGSEIGRSWNESDYCFNATKIWENDHSSFLFWIENRIGNYFETSSFIDVSWAQKTQMKRISTPAHVKNVKLNLKCCQIKLICGKKKKTISFSFELFEFIFLIDWFDWFDWFDWLITFGSFPTFLTLDFQPNQKMMNLKLFDEDFVVVDSNPLLNLNLDFALSKLRMEPNPILLR